MCEPRLLLSGITWYVSALTDTGSGSSNQGDLRYCITEANLHTGDIVITASGTDTLGSSLPALTGDTTITDSDPGGFVVEGGGAGSDYNALTINSGVTATISGVDFTSFDNSGDGGILDVEGTLTLDDSDLTSSHDNLGGAVYVGFEGFLTADQSTFEVNSSDDGGAILNLNSVILNGGSFLSNLSNDLGGAIYDDGYLDANGVEFAGNSDNNSGGAIFADEGMGEVASGLVLTNSTVDSNEAVNDGGGITVDCTSTFTNDTIANNTSGDGSTGAGLYIGSGFSPVLNNTLVAQNDADGTESDIDGSSSIDASSSYNLIGDTSVSGVSDGSQGNQVGTSASPLDAGLGSRAYNGGGNDTIALAPGSPAIGAGLVADAIDPTTGDPLLYDQRGVGFPRVVNGSVDIGAFQTQTASTTLAVSAASGTYGGTTDLLAHLTSGGSPIPGELVDFHLGATDLGDTTTDANGLAEIENVSLAGLDAGTYTGDITASFAGDSSYASSGGSADLTVSQAPLTITANDQSKVYGQDNPTLTGTVNGVLNGDDVTANYSTTAAPFSDVGGYAITFAGLTGAKADDYSTTVEGGSFTPGTLFVTQAPLTVVVDDQSKVYGDEVPTLTGSVYGILNDDDVSALYATDATASSDVDGNPYDITLDGLIGSKSEDYSTTVIGGSETDGTLTVTPAPLTITADDQGKTYGAALPMLTASYSGFMNGDTAADLTTAPTITTTATAASHVDGSPYDISASGAVDDNYDISYVDGNLYVFAAPLTITADNQSNVYGDALPTLTASYDGFVNGDTSASLDLLPTITTTATAASHVDGSPYDISASGAVDDDYDISYVDGSLYVTPAPLTITADNQTKVYGAAVPTLTASYAGFVNGDTSDDLGTLPTITTEATDFSDVSGSPYEIDAGGAADDDYTIGYATGQLTVTPAPLTITIDSQSKVYGQENPAFTGTVSGLLNDDDVTADYTSSAGQFSDVGSYAITLAGLAGEQADDYSTTVEGGSLTPGTLTVTPAPLTVFVADQSKVYGQVNPTPTGVFLGALNDDDVSVDYGSTAGQFSDVGAYAISATGLGGTKADDYSLSVEGSSVTPGTLSITPAPLAVVVNNQTKVYGQANPSLTGTVAGVLNNDAVTAQFATTATTSSDVGGYAIGITGLTGSKAADYTITNATPGTLTVTPAPLTVTAGDASKQYGQANPAFTASYGGFVLGEDPSVLSGTLGFSTPATSASHVGDYAVTPDGLTSPDYTIIPIAGNLSITPALLTITAPNVVKTYGQPVPDLIASFSGFVNGDTSANLSAQPTLSTAATVGSHVSGSPYAVTASGASDPDYTISYAPGSVTITPAPLIIAANDQSQAYGGAVPAPTASYEGFVNGDTPADLTTPVSLTTTASPSSQVGRYLITPSGASSSDYAISFANGTDSVTPATLTVTANNAVMPFDGPLPTFSASYSGFVNGDTPASLTTPVSLSTTATATSPSGAYPINVSGGSSPDYTIVGDPGTLEIQEPPTPPADPGQAAFVSSLYQDLLGRTPQQPGYDVWSSQLSHGVPPFVVAIRIYRSPEARAYRAQNHGHTTSLFKAIANAKLARNQAGQG